MATRKPRLTRARLKYVDQRSSGLLVGKPLTYSAGQAERYAAGIASLTEQMFREYARELAALYKELPPITTDASISSQAGLLLTRLKRKFAALFAQRAPEIADRMMSGVDKAAQATLSQSLKEVSGGITLKTDKMPAALKQAAKASTIENVALIKSIGQTYHTQIEGAVMRSLQPGGRGMADVRDALEKYKGITDKRKDLIARDQVRKVSSAIYKERAQSAGIKSFRWRHSGGGSEPRPDHVAMNNTVYSYDDLPIIDRKTGERGLPGQLINCHPGDSNVEIAHGCMKLYRRRYSGELVTFVSDNGVVLKATSNHPILTIEGWKPAKDINLGDYLVKSSHHAVNIPKADVHHPISTFDQFFDAALRLFGRSTAGPGNAAFQFHGDTSDNEVDIVDIGSCLSVESDPRAIEQLGELILAFADSAINDTACGYRSSDAFVVASLLSPDSRMGSVGALLSEIGGKPSRAHETCLGLVAYLDTRSKQNPAYWAARDSVFLGQLKLAHTQGVFLYDVIVRQILAMWCGGNTLWNRNAPSADRLGEIVRIGSKKPSNGGKVAPPVEHAYRVVDKFVSENSLAHVYNLETLSNWYVVNGIITHNCRCVQIPVLSWAPEEEPEDIAE